jgi:phosphoglycolate phosphatase-like HAD superfamily hydrolase
MKTYCFDLDGTLCTNTEGAYQEAEPLLDRIEKVNELYENGIRIHIFTARGTVTGIDWRALTEEQLKKWGVKYHELQLGKPFAHIYVDDRGISDKEFFA